MAEVIIRRDAGDGERVKALAGGALQIPSFTKDGVFYDVHPDSGYCQCERFEYTDHCVKHVVTAQGIQRVRELRFFGEVAEAYVMNLCKRIFAPIKKGETLISASDLFWDVYTYRYSTKAMKDAAYERYKKVERREGRAA